MSRAWADLKHSDDWEGMRANIAKRSKDCKPYSTASQANEARENLQRQWQQIEESTAVQKKILEVVEQFKQQAKMDRQHENQRSLLHNLWSNYEKDKNFNPKKVEGTCEWFLTNEKLLQWRDCNVSKLIWLSAGPGCGKSVLSRSLIDEGHLSTRKMTTTVCYFFFKDGDANCRSGADALSATLHQFFSNSSDNDLFEPALERHSKIGPGLRHTFKEL